MPTAKELEFIKTEIDEIEIRLKNLEEREDPNAELEKLHTKQEKFSKKLNGLTAAPLLLTILLVILNLYVGFRWFQAEKSLETIQKAADISKKMAQEPWLGLFEEKIKQTLDRVSFFEPADAQHTSRLEKLKKMKSELSELGLTDEAFNFRAQLVDVIDTVVQGDKQKTDQALDALARSTTDGKDNFVNARVLTLQAIALVRAHPDRRCLNPEAKSLVEEAIEKDREISAAYNILASCIAAQTIEKVKKPDERDPAIAQEMQKAINYFELSYSLSPTNWSRSRTMNNKVYNSSLFLLHTLGKDDIRNKYLLINGHKDINEFFIDSINQMEFCKKLSPNLTVWRETQAELYGLQYRYFQNVNHEKAKDALQKEREQYLEAIGLGLFKRRSYETAMVEFKGDELLSDVLKNDPEIERAIRNSLRPQ